MYRFDEIDEKIPGFDTLKIQDILRVRFNSEGSDINLLCDFKYFNGAIIRFKFCRVVKINFEMVFLPMEAGELLISERSGFYVVYDDLQEFGWECKDIVFLVL